MSQNLMNRGKQKNNTTGHKGISRNRMNYRAALEVNGKIVFDKTYRTLEEAVSAHEKAAKRFHGEFANTE